MPAPILKLGTRRSALARAQSGAVARELERRHPGLHIELVGIDTRGDRILDKPLASVDGKEFFTAELDSALLEGRVDLTVHSFKDLSLERHPQLLLAAVPQRAQPHDIALFAPDVQERLAAGATLRIGSSSPRRAALLPALLPPLLPTLGAAVPAIQVVELRGNVDSRLRRLHEPRGSERHLDGIVLALAGLARLWADESGRQLLATLLTPLPRMVLPLGAMPTAPAQGALAIECRADDASTAALLRSIDHAPTRQAVARERQLLAARGGGCHQRFGATDVHLPGLGSMFYLRDALESSPGQAPVAQATQLQWQPDTPLPALPARVTAWDGSRSRPGVTHVLPEGIAQAQQWAQSAGQGAATAGALFVSHRLAFPDMPVRMPCWVPGLETWEALAVRGVWVQGCADGLGFEALQPLLQQAVLQLPPLSAWAVLTHREAAQGWSEVGTVIATYTRAAANDPDEGGPPANATHVYWHSGAQFDRWHSRVGADVVHACGAGRTRRHLQAAGVPAVLPFPGPMQWRRWVGLS